MPPKINRLIVLLAVIMFASPSAFAANVGNTTGQAWAEKFGWISLGSDGVSAEYGVSVADAALSGYAWSEKTGYINFDDAGAYYAVTNDGAGNLSGYAWSETLGYISFDDSSANNYYQVTLAACASSTPGSVIFRGTTIFKATAIVQPGQPQTFCFSGYAWAEKGGYVNFNDAGSYYGATTLGAS